MNVLHITPHLGGGVGTVVSNWMLHVNDHQVCCLDTINAKVADASLAWDNQAIRWYDKLHPISLYRDADIVVVHWWDHPMLHDFFSHGLPEARLVFWGHKNYPIPEQVRAFPDVFVNTSRVMGSGFVIWSTGDMTRFFSMDPSRLGNVGIGYIGTLDWKKVHPHIIDIFKRLDTALPNSYKTIAGENHIWENPPDGMLFSGHVDDVKDALQWMEIFAYPLRSDHYGTCEQALGEAMARGCVPVVMDNPAERLIIEHGVNGLIAPTPEDFVGHVVELVHNRVLRERLQRNARRTARELYNTPRMVSTWERTLECMMRSPKRCHAPLEGL